MPTILGMCEPTFYTFYIIITSEVLQYYEVLYLTYRPQTECSISQFFKTNYTQSTFRTINRGLLAKPFKKCPKSPIRPAGSHFCHAPNLQCKLWSNIKHNKEFVYFLFKGFWTMCYLKKRWYMQRFNYSCKQCLWTTENKQHSH